MGKVPSELVLTNQDGYISVHHLGVDNHSVAVAKEELRGQIAPPVSKVIGGSW